MRLIERWCRYLYYLPLARQVDEATTPDHVYDVQEVTMTPHFIMVTAWIKSLNIVKPPPLKKNDSGRDCNEN